MNFSMIRIGSRFHRLVVVQKYGELWLCRCTCGRRNRCSPNELLKGYKWNCKVCTKSYNLLMKPDGQFTK